MSQQLPKYLKRIKTSYNNFEGYEAIPQSTDSGDDTDTTSSGALEPSTFGGSINENSREWMRKFVNYTSLNKVEDADKLIMLESLLDKRAQCLFANLDDATRKSWPDLKQRFEETYYNANS